MSRRKSTPLPVGSTKRELLEDIVKRDAANDPPFTVAQAAEWLGCHKTNASETLRYLHAKGLVKRTGKGLSGQPYRYGPTDRGRQEVA